ncbi:cyclin-like protein [Crepidotus variabilis]|uniref:Cyclin-like protein n=1 Tax=Crepidotus variabilis TaxID=179855 RepID=A0A9P6E872_9AGAR|nr:cyclin-like protein [Crepidotus variabilis]
MPPIKQSSSSSKFSSKHYHPYFNPTEIEQLSEKQRGKQSATQEEKVRQTACTFIETISTRIGFPRRTVATAQTLYHRFHLFFPRKDFQYQDVSLAAIFVSAKMHDTLKKPRELLAISYGIRYPDLAAKSKHPGGEIDLDTMDATMVESDRQRLLAVERLILETVCFNFTARMPFPYVIKLGKELQASKKLIKFAWRIAIDTHRTLLPLIYPPQTLALGSIYTAGLLLSFEQPNSPQRDGETSNADLANQLNKHLDWEKKFQSKAQDLDDIAHTFLDLLIQFTQSSTSANTSPSTPSSPSPHLSSRDRQGSLNQQQFLNYPYNADQLIRLKIAMRQTEFSPRKRWPIQDITPTDGSGTATVSADNDNTGQNDGTVRFLFFPSGHEGEVFGKR